MRIQELYIKNFRNLEENTYNFNNNINYIYGQNAQGKTNLLESIWMLTGARSFRHSKDGELINFNNDFASIKAKVVINNNLNNITVNFGNNKRKIFLNEVPMRSPSEIIGFFKVVLFSPLNLNLIKDGPDNRRRLIDSALCQLYITYTKILVKYTKLLKHRNMLLKNYKNYDYKFLETLDEELCRTGSSIIMYRLDYLERLKIKSQKIYSEISNNQEKLDINYNFYKMNINKISEVRSMLLDGMRKNFDLDIRLGYTSIGPHKDDIEIFINNKPAKNYGSQGQQRSIILSLKLAESEITELEYGVSPVILLDDVMSELDSYRQEYLLTKILNKQVFITGCDELLLEKYNNNSNINKLHINCGKLI